MTDEEMAEERATKFADINFNEPDNYGSEKEIGHFSYVAGFLAGLKAVRPEWHKVADGDLPEKSISVLAYFEKEDVSLVECLYIPNEGFRHPVFSEWYTPTAWCEIPKYTEED